MTEISKANQKYLDLLAAVDAEKAVVAEKEAAATEARGKLIAAQSKVAKFEQKHQGETLLKPVKLPSVLRVKDGVAYAFSHTFNDSSRFKLTGDLMPDFIFNG